MLEHRIELTDSQLDVQFIDSSRSPGVGTLRALMLSFGLTATACVTPEALKPLEYPKGVRYPELSDASVNPYPARAPYAEGLRPQATAFRIFVCDGAFFQHEQYSASSWVSDLCKEVMHDRGDMKLDVTCITYSERNSIASSATKFAELVCQELRNKPLQGNEQILLVGHSQGAFIQTYLLRKHEEDSSFCPNFPWEQLHGSITIDIPLGDIRGYKGPLCELLPPLRTLVKTDPFVFPTIVGLIYPSALDYVKETDALKLVQHPAQGETRFIRTNKKGEPVFIGVSGCDVDNPNSQWSHHPFLAGHIELPKDKEFREKLRDTLCNALGFENIEIQPATSVAQHNP